MKKLLLVSAVVGLLMAHLVRVRFVVASGDSDDTTGARQVDAESRLEKRRELPAPITNPEQEWRTYAMLDSGNELECTDLTVEEAIDHLSAMNGVSIRLDQTELDAAKVPAHQQVTMSFQQIPLRQILDRILIPLDLDWFVDEQGILVTTRIAAAKRLDRFLNYELQILHAICELSDAQTQKLLFVGRYDLKRVMDRIQECRAIIQTKDDSFEQLKKVNEALREMETLHKSIEVDPFGKDSFYRKSLKVVLTREQMDKYEPIRGVLEKGGKVATKLRGPDVLLIVRLTQTPFTDDDLLSLKKLRILGSLKLELTKVTDAGLIHLLEMENLRELSLFGVKITDTGLIQLKQLTNLQALLLGSTQLTDAGITHLKALPNLQDLNLNYLKLSDDGFNHLQGMTSLRRLHVAFSQVSDDGLINLKQLTNLEELGLCNSSITDAGLVHLAGLAKLERLDLSMTQLTDAALNDFKQMHRLRSVNLARTKITEAGLANLALARPDLKLLP